VLLQVQAASQFGWPQEQGAGLGSSARLGRAKNRAAERKKRTPFEMQRRRKRFQRLEIGLDLPFGVQRPACLSA